MNIVVMFSNVYAFGQESSVTVTDIDGNVYHTVTIGTQVWMVENLKTTRYRNGDTIGTTTPVTKNINSETEPKYQWAYNGDESNVTKYGRMYTWYVVNDSRNIAPIGWHVPTYGEWLTLVYYLSANGYNYDGTTAHNRIAKSLASNMDWNTSTDTGAIGNDLTMNNTSGFSALPCGTRDSDGKLHSFGYKGNWWSSHGYAKNAWSWSLYYSSYDLFGMYNSKNYGFSVRCVRD